MHAGAVWDEKGWSALGEVLVCNEWSTLYLGEVR